MGTLLKNRLHLWAMPVLTIALFTTAACTTKTSAATTPPAPDVEIATVEQRDVPIYREWIGTLDGMVNAAIKAQEAKGQLAQAKAQLTQARAQLAQSVANQGRTQLDVDKYTPLAKQQAVTQQELDNAVQNNIAAKAQIEAGKASVETAQAQIEASNAAVESSQAAVEAAQVNIGFTHLTSPIDGIAGQAQVQVGNLVSPSSGVITTVSTLDPIKAIFTVGEQEYLSLTRGVGNDLAKLPLDLILADGSTYPQKGKFSFADRQVNQGTGAIQLTAIFPNPGNRLRPGQYGKVHAAIGTSLGALLIPQRAVTELQGAYQVAVVDSANTVGIRTVKVGDRIGEKWIVSEGLKPGERVVTEGVQKTRPGMKVNPKPFVESK